MEARDYISGETFRVNPTVHGWWATTPAPDDLGRYYGDSYHVRVGRRRFPAPVEWVQRRLYRRRARQVTDAAGGTGHALDVGCGPGHLLAELRALGWAATGTEATERAAEVGRRSHGLDVRVGELGAHKFGEGEFQAIISWHTLEHMREPGAVLDEIVRILAPGGVLLISVPDFGSAEAQARPPAWFHLDVPRHLCHFPAAVLRRELERRGLVIERESHNTPEYDAFSLLQTWQNRLGLPQNLLYRRLKSAPPDGGWPCGSTLAALGLGAALFPAALALAAWRGLRGTGAVVVFLARKGRLPSGAKSEPLCRVA